MIHCHKCKTVNPTNAEKCGKCGKDLLPGSSFGERVTGFGCMILLAAISIPAMYFCSSSAIAIGEGTGRSIALLILGPIMAVSFLIIALVIAFRKVALYERYQNRANRHIKLDPQQAIQDFSQAFVNLPQKTSDLGVQILISQAELFTQEGRNYEAQAGFQQALAIVEDLVQAKPQKEKLKYMEERANLLEKLGRQEEADREGLNYTYLAEKALPEKKIAMGAMEGIEKANIDSKRNDIYKKRKAILDRGLFITVGYCRKCKTAVQLDYTLVCPVNPKHDKIDSIQFVLAGEVEKAKQEISIKR
jgi:tetratricopeptide (TPR) repeat protein